MVDRVFSLCIWIKYDEYIKKYNLGGDSGGNRNTSHAKCKIKNSKGVGKISPTIPTKKL
jgi:hypothetical protein